MDRQSLAMQAEITQATQNYVKEVQAIRARHGFGRLTLDLSSTSQGAKVSVDVEVDLRMEFDRSGEIKPPNEPEPPEDFKIQSLGASTRPAPLPASSEGISSHHKAIITRIENEDKDRNYGPPRPTPDPSRGTPIRKSEHVLPAERD